MSITMKDVAARAGVTPTVVSRVLHNKATSIRVSEATAERVRIAAKDLGYRVNVMARNFRERQTMMIGVLHGTGFGRPRFSAGSGYFASLFDGIVDGGFEAGYSITLCPKLLGERPEDAISDGRFDGLVWYSTVPSASNRAMLEHSTVPIVLIHTPSADFSHRFSAVLADNYQGVGLAVDHLVERGHTRIAFAVDTADLFGEVQVRLEAFRSHMHRHGLPSDERDVLDVGLDRLGIKECLTNNLRHTAIIAQSDALAAVFLSEAPKYGVSVPGDLAVIGFDSTSYCLELRPTLTSISQPLTALGRTAVELLVRRINNESSAPAEVVLPCGLDIREST